MPANTFTWREFDTEERKEERRKKDSLRVEGIGSIKVVFFDNSFGNRYLSEEA